MARGLCFAYDTKLGAMTTSHEELEKLDWSNTFHLVKKILKIGLADTEIALLIVKKLEMRGKAQRTARSAPRCRPLVSNNETKMSCQLANVQRMHVVSICYYYGNIIWLPWQRPLPNRKIRSTLIICTQSTLIVRKDCKNRSSKCIDIRRNMPGFWFCRTRRSQMSSVNSGVTWPNFTKFSHNIQASFALLMRAAKPWYCNSFSITSATNTSGIGRRL